MGKSYEIFISIIEKNNSVENISNNILHSANFYCSVAQSQLGGAESAVRFEPVYQW